MENRNSSLVGYERDNDREGGSRGGFPDRNGAPRRGYDDRDRDRGGYREKRGDFDHASHPIDKDYSFKEEEFPSLANK